MSGLTLSALSNRVFCAEQAISGVTGGPVIQIEEVNRFYAVYDAADGHPSAEQLQRDYLDPGSDGLHTFAKAFRNTATRWKGSVSEASRCLATPGESSWTTKYTTTVPLPKELLANHRADTLLVSRGYRDCDGYYRSTSPAEARERRQGGRIDGVV